MAFLGIKNTVDGIVVHIYILRLQRKDLLQLMLDAKDETGGQKIDNEDIQAQSLVFLLAGYETSSTTLAFACYHLALDTHVQDKLRDEIDRMWPEDEVGIIKRNCCESIFALVCDVAKGLKGYFL